MKRFKKNRSTGMSTIRKMGPKGTPPSKTRHLANVNTKALLVLVPFLLTVVMLTNSTRGILEIPLRRKESEGSKSDIANLQIDLDPMANVFPACTATDLVTMAHQLKRPKVETACPESNWIEDFYQTKDLEFGSTDGSFLGITIGCNKAFDAIDTARMGTNNPVFNKEEWKGKLQSHGIDLIKGVCGQHRTPQYELKKSEPRGGEMHCVEPMPSTVEILVNVTNELNLDKEGFVVTKAAISSRDGKTYFPRAQKSGKENIGMHNCNSNNAGCVEVPMYSLETYVESYVKSTGPINILSVDVEGFDFDVLFGAGQVLDRTQYLEFEYHKVGHWGKLHVHDLVNLLDFKGFNCYWAGKKKLWRITHCELDQFDKWHGWSNVACVHRSQNELAQNMENIFLATIGKTSS